VVQVTEVGEGNFRVKKTVYLSRKSCADSHLVILSLPSLGFLPTTCSTVLFPVFLTSRKIRA